ncbi:DUF1552 domain-containing protein [Lignipirellula cremea]|uniref:DUF1552 domain-containing protein n=1 Tax=Lignipirellula cremea TaxID=2528010 RepID=A0A518DM19_9BACT|nr:DUF1552 domain-containing protein [Lignipirellula cremea]QDU92888.1 hypothetical protein Pla8534_06610 [Lignipirellula cremea]
MSKKTWQIDRRTCLQGAGVSLALPFLDAMSRTARAKETAEPLPKRMCCILFPFGVALPKDDAPDREWGWFPTGEGENYQLTSVLQPLAQHRSRMTIFGGLSHPNCRSMNGHDTGDTWLTGNAFHGATCQNTVSMDQLAAQHLGDHTRFRSVVLSSDGGIGPRTRSTTLSYSAKGQPIPALSEPKQIFQRLFAADGSTAARSLELDNSSSVLDLVLESSRSLHGKIGRQDQVKLDEYLSSVRDVEQRVDRARDWLHTPRPHVDPSVVNLDADPQGPEEYIKAIYDLMYLALQTDSTRLLTYMIGSYGPTIARTFPTAVGLADWHGLAHGAGKEGGPEKIGRFDQFLAKNLAYFLDRLRDTPEQDGNLLDRTLVLYGSSNSRTHQNVNYPLLLAGGNKLGLKHGRYLQYGDDTPMSNLLVTMLQQMGVPVNQFADSTGPLKELLA